MVCNLTPEPRYDYRVGVPQPGLWREVLNSDDARYGGSNLGNHGAVQADDAPWHGRDQSLRLTLPPLATIVLTPDGTPAA